MSNAKTKILHISTATTWRGGEQQLAYLYEELHKQNIEQLIICAHNSALHDFCQKNNFHCATLTKQWNTDIFYALRLSKIVKAFNADIIHAHDAHAHTLALITKNFFNTNAKLVVSRRVDFPVKNNFLSSWKYNSKHISKIICVSEAIENIMLQTVSKNKLAVVHSGIDCNKFEKSTGILRKEFSLPNDTLIIADVAALAPHKDYFTFLKTVKLLKEKYALNAKYFAIGDGELKTLLLEEAEKLNLKNDVIFTGFRNDLNKIFSEIDVLLFTSETEGLGTTLLDAFCCGVPVVATNAGGVSELVTHEKTGMLSPVKNAEQLAENVYQLTGNETLKNTIVANAKEKAVHFSKQQTALKTLCIYKEVLS
jgi:glycosyltransferase involved in cell wall biosynthesis